ncbi:hypothetical protein BY996DRAFT_6419213 [Phakopsora pachyrhizi]|nr:hypothetical protein BY996DRAFT_6419213 [Phakopsora pachyrhizi]
MQYFSVQDEVAEVMNFARQLAARICGSVRGQSKSLRTKYEAQNSAQFQNQSAKNQSTPAVKSNFEQNLDVQAHIAASILLILSPTQMTQSSRKLKLLASYQKENEIALIELGQAKSRMLKVLNLFSKAYRPDWEQMIILQMTGSSGSNHQIILENSQPLQSTATKIKDEEERIEELIKDKNT